MHLMLREFPLEVINDRDHYRVVEVIGPKIDCQPKIVPRTWAVFPVSSRGDNRFPKTVGQESSFCVLQNWLHTRMQVQIYSHSH